MVKSPANLELHPVYDAFGNVTAQAGTVDLGSTMSPPLTGRRGFGSGSFALNLQTSAVVSRFRYNSGSTA
jgi:hypothetical protein